MFRASISLAFAGSPAVRATFWSKSLKLLVRVRKVQMVTLGMTIGILILKRISRSLAPSILAASMRSPGTLCRPAT